MFNFEIKDNDNVLVFLDSVIVDDKNRILALKLIFNVKYSYRTYTYVADISESIEIYNKYRFDKRYYLDFSFSEDGTKLSYSKRTVRRLLMNVQSAKDIIGQHTDCTSTLTSIYDLFDEIISKEGLYISTHCIDNILENKNNYEDEGLVNFNMIRISESTMSISFSVFIEGAWKTELLVDVENDNLKANTFYFAVETHKLKSFDKYDITHVADAKINNLNMSILKYDPEYSVGLYKHVGESFKLIPTLLTYYCRDLEIAKSVVRTSEYFIDYFLKDTYKKSSNKEVPRHRNIVFKPKVIFESSEKSLSTKDLNSIFQDVSIRRRAINQLDSSEDAHKVRISAKDMSIDCAKYKSPSLASVSYRMIDDMICSCPDVKTDILDLATKYKNFYSNRLTFDKLYLYTFRATCFLTKTCFGKLEHEIILEEPDSTRYVKIRRISYGV